MSESFLELCDLYWPPWVMFMSKLVSGENSQKCHSFEVMLNLDGLDDHMSSAHMHETVENVAEHA